MKIEKQACNFCEKETTDHYLEIGWIVIEGIRAVTISEGREEGNGSAVTRYRTISHSEKPLEFCCIDCLVNWVANIKSSKRDN